MESKLNAHNLWKNMSENPDISLEKKQEAAKAMVSLFEENLFQIGTNNRLTNDEREKFNKTMEKKILLKIEEKIKNGDSLDNYFFELLDKDSINDTIIKFKDELEEEQIEIEEGKLSMSKTEIGSNPSLDAKAVFEKIKEDQRKKDEEIKRKDKDIERLKKLLDKDSDMQRSAEFINDEGKSFFVTPGWLRKNFTRGGRSIYKLSDYSQLISEYTENGSIKIEDLERNDSEKAKKMYYELIAKAKSGLLPPREFKPSHKSFKKIQSFIFRQQNKIKKKLKMDENGKITEKHKNSDRDLVRLRLLNLISSVNTRLEKLLEREGQLFYDESQGRKKRPNHNAEKHKSRIFKDAA